MNRSTVLRSTAAAGVLSMLLLTGCQALTTEGQSSSHTSEESYDSAVAAAHLNKITHSLDRISNATNRSLPQDLSAKSWALSQSIVKQESHWKTITERRASLVAEEVSGPVRTVAVHLSGEAGSIVTRRKLVSTPAYETAASVLNDVLVSMQTSEAPDLEQLSLLAVRSAEYVENLDALPVAGEGVPVVNEHTEKAKKKRLAAETKRKAEQDAKDAQKEPDTKPVAVNSGDNQVTGCSDLGSVLLEQKFSPGQSVDIESNVPWTSTVESDGTVTVRECND